MKNWEKEATGDKPKLYIETSIVSYLTSQPSRDIVTAARQQVTRDWWQTRRSRFELYISAFVLSEVSSGDSQAAALRKSALDGIPELALTDQDFLLARELV